MAKSMYGITCPCGYDFDSDDIGGLVSYWGEDPAKEVTCPSCGAEGKVRENVVRTYDVSFSARPSETEAKD